jgi:UDP-2,4-diacetamido-2,4,6-trideoxy-beta-L-altropyranose hydrolase/UDP-4-amino-4,6-dideoxy-N-acetyl-beta-L-altrosamine N-acetyltransferase
VPGSGPGPEGLRQGSIHTLKGPGNVEDTLSILRTAKPAWTVLDGYRFDQNYQRAIRDAGSKLLVIDDFAQLEHYYADIILNQNLGAGQFRYHAEPCTRFLLGTDYVLLRSEFLRYKSFERKTSDFGGKLLITMGGSDPENYTQKILRAVNCIDTVAISAKVVVGASNRHYEVLEKEARTGSHEIEVLQDVQDMPRLMAWADAAVSAGGTTAWELAFMGLPSILCIIAENQVGGVTALEHKGAVASTGWVERKSVRTISSVISRLMNDPSWRRMMTSAGRELVDGEGTERVLRAMMPDIDNLRYFHENINFGAVKFCNFCNLPEDDKWMVLTNEEHEKFIEKLRTDHHNFYWLVCEEEKPVGVGYVQDLDYEQKEAFIGIYTKKKGTGNIIFQYLLYIGFELMNLRIMKCELVAENVRAYDFYHSFGFHEEGHVHHRAVDGRSRRVICMSMSRENWDRLQYAPRNN